MHFSGCSASCAQPQIADIGFRGDIAHVDEHIVEAVDIGLGGWLGPDAAFIDWVVGAMPVDEVPEALRASVTRYQAERRRAASPSTLGPPHAERRAAANCSSVRCAEGRVKRYRLREEMNGIAEPPGKVWFWELEAGVIDADRCVQCGACVAVCPSNSHRGRRGHRPARAGQDVHRLLALLGLLPPRRPALRGAVAPVHPVEADEAALAPPRCGRTPRTPTGRSPAGHRPTGSGRCSSATRCALGQRTRTSRTAGR